VKILPISDKFLEYALGIMAKLRKAGIRVEMDERSEKIGKKIREAELSRVPYMLIIGEKEMNENKISVRRQGKGDLGLQDTDSFILSVVEEIVNRKSGE
jgi:threonyl-tRNA synthetase